MRFGDLARQRQPQARAAALGGIERHQRVGQHRLAHAAAAVQYFDAQQACLAPHAQAHAVGRRARFVGILEQVQQRLLHLRHVQARGFHRQFVFEREADLAAQAVNELRPLQRLQARRRQLGKVRIAADESLQVPRTLLDGAEHRLQPVELAAARELGARVRQRRHRRQRIVQLVADDADHLLPGLHFLAPQLGRQLAQHEQRLHAAVEPELAARDVPGLFVVVGADGKQAVAAGPHRVAQRLGRRVQQFVQVVAFEPAPAVELAARRQVGVAHAARGIHQHHRHRRVLHHGVEQQFALHQAQALFAQRVAQGVVRAHQFAHLVAALPRQAEAEITVAVAVHRAGQRAEQRQHRLQRAPHRHRHHRQHQQQRKTERGHGRAQPRLQHQRQAHAHGQQDEGQARQPSCQRPSCAPDRGHLSRARCPAAPAAGTAPGG